MKTTTRRNRTFPALFSWKDKRAYVANLRAIRFNESHGINAGHVENLRNLNFGMVQGAQFNAGPFARLFHA